MADLKISALTASTVPLAGTEVLPIVQSSTTKQVSVANLTAGRTVAASNLAIGTGASASGFNTTVAINRSGGGSRGILFQDGGSDQSGLYTDSGATGTLYIFSNGTRPISMSVNGAESVNLDTSNNVKVTAGNLIIGTAAKGVNFTANTPLAGMTSQLLNWYEDGTYTPTATASTGSITSYTSSGTYTRIGRQVTVSLVVTITNAGTGTGALQVSLPFTVGSTAGIGAGTEDANTGVMLQIQAAASGATGFVKTYLGATPIATNNLLRLTVTYFV